MSGHSPAPWSISARRGGSVNGAIIRDAAGVMVAQMPCSADKPYDQKKSDARLIATAPDLLTAAQAVRETCPCDPDINPRWNAAWDALMAAIIKAEGSARAAVEQPK